MRIFKSPDHCVQVLSEMMDVFETSDLIANLSQGALGDLLNHFGLGALTWKKESRKSIERQ